MKMSEAAELVFQRFKTWADAEMPQMPYCFDNEMLAEPDISVINPCWARVGMRTSASRQETIGAVGNRKFRRQAVIYVQLFGRTGIGRGRIDDVAHDVITLYEGTRIGPVGDPEQQVIARTALQVDLGADGRWYNVTVEIPVDYYETK